MQISTVKASGGKLSLRVDGDTVVIAGELDQLTPRELMAGFIEIVHTMALGERLVMVNVDVTRLALIHSSGVKEFLSWILRRNRVPRERKYKLNFLFDPAVAWQPLTLGHMRDLDPEGVVLTPSSPPREIALRAVL